uniref:Uncharacterized protein AlNc14C234G9352 n=1 Tax=Albugo laibachii Nc14 TaxID=890382 RepID=F0WSK8_9STRA|nr:conserved hypothetical protein [Albugo laibachii Nc14]|eukprot:CCA24334.1 conserved hypothetical protein [Albugo laibachii Nc14]
MVDSSSKTTIFVRNLPFQITSKEVEDLFSQVGPVKKVDLIKNKGKSKDDTLTRGFAFVRFALESDAVLAIEKMNKSEFQGRKLCIVYTTFIDRCKSKDGTAIAPNVEEKSDENDVADKLTSDSKDVAGKPTPNSKDVESVSTNGKQSERNARRRQHRQFSRQLEESKELKASLEDRSIAIYGFSDKITDKILWKRIKKVSKHVDKLEMKEYLLRRKENKKYATVAFKMTKEVPVAVMKLDQHILKGDKLTVRPLRSFLDALKVKKDGLRLIVRNLSFQATDEDLHRVFSPFGAVSEAHVVRLPVDTIAVSDNDDKEGSVSILGRSRGFGFVQFNEIEAAASAVKAINGNKLKGREIVVDFAVPKTDYLKQNEESVKTSMNDDLDNAEADTDAESIPEANIDDNGETEPQDEDMTDISVDNDEEAVESDGASEECDNGDDTAIKDIGEVTTDNTQKSRTGHLDTNEQLERTLFLRNVSFQTTDEGLKTFFQTFGGVEYTRIVYDPNSKLSKGVAFVRFKDIKPVNYLLDRAQAIQSLLENTQQDLASRSVATTKNERGMTDVYTASALADGSALILDGRVLSLARAVRKEQAVELASITPTNTKSGKDKRNLYLAYEGTINVNKISADQLMLPKLDIEKRRRALKEKKEKLKNPMYFISPVRLSFRNLASHVDDTILKKLVRDAAICGMEGNLVQKKEIKSELQLPLQEKSKIPVKVRMAKVIRDQDSARPGKIARSRGYGFVEFAHHVHALCALRELNNNPKYSSFAAGNRSNSIAEHEKSRLIIEFAIENHTKLKLREKKQKDQQKRMTTDKLLMQNQEAVQQTESDKCEIKRCNRGARQRKRRREAESKDQIDETINQSQTIEKAVVQKSKWRRETEDQKKSKKQRRIEPKSASSSRKARKQIVSTEKERSFDTVVAEYRNAIFGRSSKVEERWFK